MKNRIIGGAIICAIIIPCFIIGGIVFDIFAGIIGLLALFELINSDKEIRKTPMIVKGIAFISVPLIAFMNLDHSLITGFDPISLLIPMVLLLIPALLLYEDGYGRITKENYLDIMEQEKALLTGYDYNKLIED